MSQISKQENNIQNNTLSDHNIRLDDRVMSVSYVPHRKKYFYNRATHRFYNKVCYQLATKYNVGKGGVVLTSSGMAAINLALTYFLIKNRWEHINIIYSDELYCDTPRLLKHMVKIYDKIDTFLIDVTDTSHIKSIFKEL